MANRVDGLGIEVTREVSTDALYGKRLATLTRRASAALGCPATLLEIVECFCSAHAEFEEATIRHYAAALAFAIDEAEAAASIDNRFATMCRDRLSDRPLPRPPTADKRTSAKKAKAVTPRDLHAVCEKLRRRGREEDRLLVRLLVHNVAFGLRPSEYAGAKVDEVFLVVKSAKGTNGRGLAETRELSLGDLPDGQVESLKALIEAIESTAKGNIAALVDRLGARLRRVCKSLNVPPFSLYTTRHQAIANKKSSSSAEDVAAFAGHLSVHTARKHYAPKSGAWAVDKTAKPSPELVQLVQTRQAKRSRAPKF